MLRTKFCKFLNLFLIIIILICGVSHYNNCLCPQKPKKERLHTKKGDSSTPEKHQQDHSTTPPSVDLFKFISFYCCWTIKMRFRRRIRGGDGGFFVCYLFDHKKFSVCSPTALESFQNLYSNLDKIPTFFVFYFCCTNLSNTSTKNFTNL